MVHKVKVLGGGHQDTEAKCKPMRVEKDDDGGKVDSENQW